MITFLGYLAERAPRSLRGIIISFPSTMAVSFVFLAVIKTPDAIRENISAIYYSLLGAILFGLAFAVTSQFFSNLTPKKKWPIAATLLIASCAWILIPIITDKLPDSIFVSLLSLLIGIALLQPFFSFYANRFPTCQHPPQTGAAELFFRFLFTGSIIALSVISTKMLGAFWGAIIGASYPASFSSQLMIFQSKYPSKFLPSLIKTIPVGVLSTTGYASVVALSYPYVGILKGTPLALLASLIISLTVARLSRERNEQE